MNVGLRILEVWEVDPTSIRLIEEPVENSDDPEFGEVLMNVGFQVLEVWEADPIGIRLIEEPMENSDESEFGDFKDSDEGPDGT